MRTVALSAFGVLVAAGLALAAACGGDGGGAPFGAGEAPTATRPPSAASSPSATRTPPATRPPSATRQPSRTSSPPASHPARGGWDRSPQSIAAAGDSITRGFDACSVLSDCTRASWATGTKHGIGSLAQRLLGNPAGRSWNHAASGAMMADLPGQLTRAARHNPDLVTVLSGANDACRARVSGMTPVAEYRADFRKALATLRRAHPAPQVYVSSVPDLRRLWQQGRSNRTAERVWQLGICPSMLHNAHSDSAADEQRRQQVYDRVRAYNAVLEEECDRVQECRFDDGAVFNYRFSTSELSSWDFFHPSQRGQRKLAALAYDRITAAE